MRNRRAIVWLIVVIVILSLAHSLTTWYGGGDVSIVRRNTLLNPTANVTKITVISNGERQVSLAMEKHWRLTYPYLSSVDEPVVRKLLDALAYTPVDSYMTDFELMRLGRTHSDFKLDRPRVTLELSNGEKTSRISFGGNMPGNMGAYAMVEGEATVFCITNSVLEAVCIGADGFRRRSLFPMGMEAVASFEVKKGLGVPLMFKADGDGWTVGGAKASVNKVKAFLTELFDAKAVDFVWPTGATNESETASGALLSGYGLDSENAISIGLTFTDGVEQRVMFGNDAGEGLVYVLAHNAGAIVKVPAKLRDLAVQGAVAYTDSRLFPVEESAVVSFTMALGGVSCVVARGEGDSWRLDAPISAAADASVVKTVLGKLLSLSSADLASDGVSVAVNTNAAPMVVAAAKVLGDCRMEDLRSKDIVKIDPVVVKRIVLAAEGMSKPDSVVFDRDKRSWKVEASAKEGTVNVGGIERVLKALNPLKAERVERLRVNAAELGRYGLEKPYLTVSIDQDRDDSVRRNIIVGAQVEGGRYATIGSSDAIFVISHSTVDLLGSALIEMK